MNASEIKAKYAMDSLTELPYFMYEKGGKQCRVHTSSGIKGDKYVVYASNEWFGEDKKTSDTAFNKLKKAVEMFCKKNGYVVPAMRNAYDMTFVLKKKQVKDASDSVKYWAKTSIGQLLIKSPTESLSQAKLAAIKGSRKENNSGYPTKTYVTEARTGKVLYAYLDGKPTRI